MFNWLKDLYNGLVGDLNAVQKWIMGAINAVYSFFDQLINQLWGAIDWLIGELNSAIGQIYQYALSLYHLIMWVIQTGIPQLARWAQNELGKLWNYLGGLVSWAEAQLAAVGRWVLGELNQLVDWVIRNIWDPLYNAVSYAIRWIGREGAFVYYLLTHPDQLAAILGRYLLGSWMGLGRKYAKPFVRWILHTALSEAHTFGSIIEDIITSII